MVSVARDRGRCLGPRPEAQDYVRRYVADAWPAMSRLGTTDGASPDSWRFHTTPEDAVADADFVQENAPKRLPVKRELLAHVDTVLRREAVSAVVTGLAPHRDQRRSGAALGGDGAAHDLIL